MPLPNNSKSENIKLSNSSDNRIKKNFLLLLLDGISKYGDNLKDFYKHIDKTKYASNYHLKKLIISNFIKREQSYPFAIYVLTPLGERVKQILVQSDTMIPLWRCHALIVGFNINNFGTFDWKTHKKSQMNNWFYTEESIKDSLGLWKIHIQSTGLMKIYCPESYTDDTNKSFGQMFDIASRIARKYSEIYGMDIGLMRTIREGHKELVNSEMLVKVFGRTKIGDVWIDSSTGTNWLEETQSANYIEGLLKMPETLKQLNDKFVPAIEWLTENIILHKKILEEMSATLKEIRKNLKK